MLHEIINLPGCKATLETFIQSGKKDRDALILMPGGAYGSVCLDREGESVSFRFASHGVACFVLNYTVARRDVFPCQLHEAETALEYVRDNAEKYGVNPDRIFTVGFSAGGSLAALLGTLGRVKPAGQMLIYPVITAFEYCHDWSIRNLIGKDDLTYEERFSVSAEKHVDSTTPPTFIAHTCDDNVVPIENSLMFMTELSKNKVPFEAHIYPHGPHGFATGDDVTNAPGLDPDITGWIEHALSWMKKV